MKKLFKLIIYPITAIINLFKSKPPKWDKCTKASCWDGSNAQKRMMNILSPAFSDDKVKDYINWQKNRGCNTTHIILCNNKDGEGGGYSIYGKNMFGPIDASWVSLAKKRIKQCRKNKLAVVLWLLTDDDNGWNNQISKNFTKYLTDLKNNGLLDEASTIVVGLELDEYYNANQVNALVNATRNVYKGKIGVHHTSDKAQFASLGDILFYQTTINKSANQIKNNTTAALKHSKPVNFFELARNANRDLSQAALDAGAFAVGNW